MKALKLKNYFTMKKTQYDNEYILCAAIHWNDGIKRIHQPVNIETGIVFCGRRHHNILNSIYQLIDRQMTGKETQGFITNLDRFVDREEAGLIAFRAKQTTVTTKTLYSEDLY